MWIDRRARRKLRRGTRTVEAPPERLLEGRMARSACVGGGLFVSFFTVVGVMGLVAPGCGDDLRGLDDDGGAADGSDDGG